MRVIATHGLSDTTVERVAVAAGVSPGLVIAYFKRKDLLLLETLQVVATEFETARRTAIDAAGDDPARALTGLIDMTFDPAISAPERLAVWYAFWGEANARAVYRNLVGKQDQLYEADLERLFAVLIAQSGRADLDVEASAAGFAGILEWLWQDILFNGPNSDRRRAARIARAYLTGLFQRRFD